MNPKNAKAKIYQATVLVIHKRIRRRQNCVKDFLKWILGMAGEQIHEVHLQIERVIPGCYRFKNEEKPKDIREEFPDLFKTDWFEVSETAYNQMEIIHHYKGLILFDFKTGNKTFAPYKLPQPNRELGPLRRILRQSVRIAQPAKA